MDQLFILLDVGGYTERLRALRDAGINVIGVTPHNHPCDGFEPIQVPAEWLPSSETMTADEKGWHACGTLGLAAIQQLGLKADAFVLGESDCAAVTTRWAAFMADHEDNPDDASFICPRTRAETLWTPRWKTAPAWATITHLNALYRLSRAGADACIAGAEEMRECFGEMSWGSLVARAGGKIGKLNRTKTHMNNQTMKADPARVLIDKRLINHPIKSNSYAP